MSSDDDEDMSASSSASASASASASVSRSSSTSRSQHDDDDHVDADVFSNSSFSDDHYYWETEPDATLRPKAPLPVNRQTPLPKPNLLPPAGAPMRKPVATPRTTYRKAKEKHFQQERERISHLSRDSPDDATVEDLNEKIRAAMENPSLEFLQARQEEEAAEDSGKNTKGAWLRDMIRGQRQHFEDNEWYPLTSRSNPKQKIGKIKTPVYFNTLRKIDKWPGVNDPYFTSKMNHILSKHFPQLTLNPAAPDPNACGPCSGDIDGPCPTEEPPSAKTRTDSSSSGSDQEDDEGEGEEVNREAHCDKTSNMYAYQISVALLTSVPLPYNLLVWQSAGSGKSFEIIAGVCSYLFYFNATPKQQPYVFIVLPPSLESNIIPFFRRGSGQMCFESSLADTNEKFLSLLRRQFRVVVMGYTSFGNYLRDGVYPTYSLDTSHLENACILFDEAHNLIVPKPPYDRSDALRALETIRSQLKQKRLSFARTEKIIDNNFRKVFFTATPAAVHITEVCKLLNLLKPRTTETSYFPENPEEFDAMFLHPYARDPRIKIPSNITLSKFMDMAKGLISYYTAETDSNRFATYLPRQSKFGTIVKIPLPVEMLKRSKEALQEMERKGSSLTSSGPVKASELDPEERQALERDGGGGGGGSGNNAAGPNKEEMKLMSKWKKALTACNVNGARQGEMSQKTLRGLRGSSRETIMTHLHQHAPKIEAVINYLQCRPGKACIFSQYADGGAYQMAGALVALGWIPIRNRADLKADIEKNGTKNHHKRFIMLAGSADNDKDVSVQRKDVSTLINDIFNFPSNARGKCVRVVVLDSTMTEGISLFDCRHFLMLECPVSMQVWDQAQARTRRNCGHKCLPYKDRNVRVVLFMGTADPDIQVVDICADNGGDEDEEEGEEDEKAALGQLVVPSGPLVPPTSTPSSSSIASSEDVGVAASSPTFQLTDEEANQFAEVLAKKRKAAAAAKLAAGIDIDVEDDPPWLKAHFERKEKEAREAAEKKAEADAIAAIQKKHEEQRAAAEARGETPPAPLSPRALKAKVSKKPKGGAVRGKLAAVKTGDEVVMDALTTRGLTFDTFLLALQTVSIDCFLNRKVNNPEMVCNSPSYTMSKLQEKLYHMERDREKQQQQDTQDDIERADGDMKPRAKGDRSSKKANKKKPEAADERGHGDETDDGGGGGRRIKRPSVRSSTHKTKPTERTLPVKTSKDVKTFAAADNDDDDDDDRSIAAPAHMVRGLLDMKSKSQAQEQDDDYE